MDRFTILKVSVRTTRGLETAGWVGTFDDIPEETTDFELLRATSDGLVAKHGDQFADVNTCVIDFFFVGSR